MALSLMVGLVVRQFFSADIFVKEGPGRKSPKNSVYFAQKAHSIVLHSRGNEHSACVITFVNMRIPNAGHDSHAIEQKMCITTLCV